MSFYDAVLFAQMEELYPLQKEGMSSRWRFVDASHSSRSISIGGSIYRYVRRLADGTQLFRLEEGGAAQCTEAVSFK